MPAYVTGEGEPYRPETLFWMSAEGAVLGHTVGRPGERSSWPARACAAPWSKPCLAGHTRRTASASRRPCSPEHRRPRRETMLASMEPSRERDGDAYWYAVNGKRARAASMEPSRERDGDGQGVGEQPGEDAEASMEPSRERDGDIDGVRYYGVRSVLQWSRRANATET